MNGWHRNASGAIACGVGSTFERIAAGDSAEQVVPHCKDPKR
jgi:hypothetical protein